MVRDRLSQAPWWVLALVMGTLFGLGMVVFGLLQGESTVSAAVTGALAGAFFGLVMGPVARRAHLRQHAALGEVTPAQRRTARRAAWRGPVPADAEVCRAAVDLLDHQVVVYRRLRWAIVMYAGFLVLTVWLVVSDSPWFALELPVFAGLLLAQVWMPHHLRHRRARLVAGSLDATPSP